MQYNLYDIQQADQTRKSSMQVIRRLAPLVGDEKNRLILAWITMLLNAVLTLVAPLLIGYTIDHDIQQHHMQGVWIKGWILLGMYILAWVCNYLQTLLMGVVGQEVLYKLRNQIFQKLQELPLAFFHQNQSGDLISRINSDTDKINQFISQSLMRFIGLIVTMVGAGIFLISVHPSLGLAALVPAAGIFIFTQLTSKWVKNKNAYSLRTTGGMSAEIQESLHNFKTIIAFNRRDYFRNRFETVNQQNYQAAIQAGVANNLLMPVYSLFSNMAQLIVLAYGIYLIATAHFTVGLLISFLVYVNRFYSPLQQIAALWSGFQTALAGWDRISYILSLESDLAVQPVTHRIETNYQLIFDKVSFSYDGKHEILHEVSFQLQKGKTYAFIGPTGGGKTTIASLIARLYDPVSGTIYLDGQDLRSYTSEIRTKKIGFILQDPFLFTGTIRENILYGNEKYVRYTEKELMRLLQEYGLDVLLDKFDEGLQTRITSAANVLSLGQKQLIAFIRAVLRHPEILILDEATANIDTVTEKQLETILNKLPETTTRILIAHRLNTIEHADEIFLVNAGEVKAAGSLQHALHMLMQEERKS
ncbi:ABC transporter ATP-binding protein [Thermoflavifilum thermophilum]|uniref:ATP-binding cassette, subfamily B n=1 Tax=Thermoflavifilum thermophilum TaxID=1393122 RepID=A0A1I7NMN3_9BACT|nr:ABC transporter ATP-binding protein [Thermoflavifilum thermophilum]SFV35896.1 ATP-binding cassette, subfamily B [Thermoflavifilum thermophilum]